LYEEEVVVTSIRALRRSHGFTLIDLAIHIDIPARTLAEIEYGLQRLDYESRARLARFFQVHPDMLSGGATRPMHQAGKSGAGWQPGTVLRNGAPVVVLALASAALLTTPLSRPAQVAQVAAGAQVTSTSVPTAVSALAATSRVPRAHLQGLGVPVSRAALAPTALPTAEPVPPRFVLLEDGPHGCPIGPVAGAVVITQGYGVGTHAPVEAWGAVDLAIDGDGDGYADPDATWGAPVLASVGGVARVFMGSWPGGNFVRVIDERTGWSVAYGHLDTVAVVDGQQVAAEMPIGTVGSTGMASGPHLHYEVWRGDANVDPSGLVWSTGASR
jgi:murein DD-endopeptidase MepM/ murein hydrolase activator NlpD